MNDDDFKQTVLDYFGIEQQRHMEIMAQSSDILAKITAMNTSVDMLKTEVEKAIAGISETVPAGHAAVLDTFVGPMDEVITKVTALAAEIPAKLGSVPVPGAPAK